MQILFKSMHLLCLLLLAVLQACIHPIEVVGDGKVLSSSGKRDCNAEQSPCVQTITGNYRETYTAVPGPGAVFSHWEACPNIWGNSCSFEVDAALTRLNWFKTAPATQAVFAPDTHAQSPHTVEVEFPPAAATYLAPTIAVRGIINGPDPQTVTLRVNGGTGWVEAEVGADGNWIAHDVALVERALAPINIEISEPGYAPRYVPASMLNRLFDLGRFHKLLLDKANNLIYSATAKGLAVLDLDIGLPQFHDVACITQIENWSTASMSHVPAANAIVISSYDSQGRRKLQVLSQDDFSCSDLTFSNPEILGNATRGTSWKLSNSAIGDEIYLILKNYEDDNVVTKLLSLHIGTGTLREVIELPSKIDVSPFSIDSILVDPSQEYVYALGSKSAHIYQSGGTITKVLALTRTRLADGTTVVLNEDDRQAPGVISNTFDFWGSQIISLFSDYRVLSFDLAPTARRPQPPEMLADLRNRISLQNAILHPILAQIVVPDQDSLSLVTLNEPYEIRPYFPGGYRQGGALTYRVQPTAYGTLRAVTINVWPGTPNAGYSATEISSASTVHYAEGYHWQANPAQEDTGYLPLSILWQDPEENREYVWQSNMGVFERITRQIGSVLPQQAIAYKFVPSELALAPDGSSLFLLYRHNDYSAQQTHIFIEQRNIESNALIHYLDLGTFDRYADSAQWPLGFVFDSHNNKVYLKYQAWLNSYAPEPLYYKLAEWDVNAGKLLSPRSLNNLGLRHLPPNFFSGDSDVRYFSRTTHTDGKYVDWGIDESGALKVIEVDLATFTHKSLFAEALQPYSHISFVDGRFDAERQQFMLLSSNKDTQELDGHTFVLDLPTGQVAAVRNTFDYTQ